jgi:hypothetical protein
MSEMSGSLRKGDHIASLPVYLTGALDNVGCPN